MKKVLCFAFLSICLSCNFAFAIGPGLEDPIVINPSSSAPKLNCVPTGTSHSSRKTFVFLNADDQRRGKNAYMCGGGYDDSCRNGTYVAVVKGEHYLGNERKVAAELYKCEVNVTGGETKWTNVFFSDFYNASPQNQVTTFEMADQYSWGWGGAYYVGCKRPDKICKNPKVAKEVKRL